MAEIERKQKDVQTPGGNFRLSYYIKFKDERGVFTEWLKLRMLSVSGVGKEGAMPSLLDIEVPDTRVPPELYMCKEYGPSGEQDKAIYGCTIRDKSGRVATNRAIKSALSSQTLDTVLDGTLTKYVGEDIAEGFPKTMNETESREWIDAIIPRIERLYNELGIPPDYGRSTIKDVIAGRTTKVDTPDLIKDSLDKYVTL